MAMIPTIFDVGIIIGNRVQAVLAQLFQSKLLLVKMERMAVCAFEAGQRHEYECRKCMYVKGQADSGRHNTCMYRGGKEIRWVHERMWRRLISQEGVDKGVGARAARRFVRYLFGRRNAPTCLKPAWSEICNLQSANCKIARVSFPE